jgi:hypothetical protein
MILSSAIFSRQRGCQLIFALALEMSELQAIGVMRRLSPSSNCQAAPLPQALAMASIDDPLHRTSVFIMRAEVPALCKKLSFRV